MSNVLHERMNICNEVQYAAWQMSERGNAALASGHLNIKQPHTLKHINVI